MSLRRYRLAGIALSLALLGSASGVVHAWWGGGHKLMTLAALRLLPEDVPLFFRAAGTALGDMVAEPDNWKNPSAVHLRSTEHPEHFIDLEYLEGKPPPELRWDLVKYYISKNIDPAQAGFLPYAIEEGYERLRLAFKVYRKRPLAPEVQQRIIVYAGWLAHYCQDGCMPLHTTRDFDGKTAGDTVIQKGIHAKIDGYPETFGLTPEEISADLKLAPPGEIWPRILATLNHSFSQVERCYQLDKEGAFDAHPNLGREFILERSRASAQFTAEIWYAAWKNSE